jgi:hypothetical protein
MKIIEILNKIVDNEQLFNVEKWVLDKLNKVTKTPKETDTQTK